MHTSIRLTLATLVTTAIPLAAARAAAEPAAPLPDSRSVLALFAHPPREYSSAPLWVWNDMLTEEQIADTLRDLAEQEVRQAFVHPRPGLMTPYLSADWFRLWRRALVEAERRDMNVWIYDENSYPSGFAGGFVPDAMPESQGRGLALAPAAPPFALGPETLALFALDGDRCRVVTEAARRGEAPSAERFLAATVVRAGASPWYGGKTYVDLLMPGVTEKFLDVTLEAYRRELGAEFGRRVPGSFTDEPHIRPAGGLPWTDRLPALFAARWGYDLVEHLPSLVAPVGDWRRVRHNYYQLLLEQFIEHWAKPYHDTCAAHGLEFTGHYWEHEWPNCGLVPDNMALYAWHQRPAIDTLMNQYREDTHAQFGNARAVRELGSVANQLGMARTLCEAYGAAGWELRFADMKRIADWLYVLGVNTLNEHLSYITIRGARKRDHPQSFSYHEPWWPYYHVMARYVTRLSAALSQGEQVNRVLVLEPTTSAWLYQEDGSVRAQLDALGAEFQELLLALELNQIEYDIGCEDILARHGSVAEAGLVVGQRAYPIVVLPPRTENLNAPTLALLAAFLKGGGKVLACGPPPALVDGAPATAARELADAPGWERIDPPAALALRLAGENAGGFTIERAPGDRGILFHHRRQLTDGELLFLVNTSDETNAAGAFAARAGGVEEWDLTRGAARPYPFVHTSFGIGTQFDLPPCGSLLLFLPRDRRPAAGPPALSRTEVSAYTAEAIERVAPNVLTLDFVDVTAGGETRTGVYFYEASRFVFQKHGLPGNPWDSAVQFRDELIRQSFPPESGFAATYHFTIEEGVPQALLAVVERPDLYTITCNGVKVAPRPGEWWLDRAFGVIDIAAAARVGDNTLAIEAAPFTLLHELEPAYILGSFRVEAREEGFALAPDAPLALGAWNRQGHPFYAAGVAYRRQYDLPAAPAGTRRIVALADWSGSVADVVVNGVSAGVVAYPPWECDITERVREGLNTIEVVVVGTLKNTLGPHHAGPGLGSAWPGMFQQAPAGGALPPGAAYASVEYGLFEPFALIEERQD